jgi:ribosome-associated toxin RatA of RatAB toxin-antitoxin module
MGIASRWSAFGLVLGLGCSAGLPAEEFTLSEAESGRVEQRELVIRADLDAARRRGTVRAAMLIEAPPAVVFGMMTRCEDAVEYVPGLRVCRVRSSSADGRSQLVEHEVDFGWYSPRIRYVFRAELVADRRITFQQDHGDFKNYEGVWEFEPVAGNAERTLLRYRAFIDPPGYVPNWLARSTFKRELPRMLTDLRLRCEAEQRQRTETHARR